MLKDIHTVTLNWIANNADKKGLKRFIDEEYSRNKIAKPAQEKIPVKKVEKDWQRLAQAFKGKLK